MKAVVLVIVFTLFFQIGRSQIAISNDNIHGTPLNGVRYQNVKGSPYLNEDWAPARVTLRDGRSFDILEIKVDQIADEVLFRGKDDQIYTFDVPVKTFSFHSADGAAGNDFRSGFPPIDNNTTSSFYQVLVDGPVQLLKRVNKGIIDTRPYGYSNTVRTITESVSYYLKGGNRFLRLKREKIADLKIFKDTGLDAFIKEGKINLSKEEDLIKAVHFVNAG